jgi:dTDP-4-amino-4,6-dideoxygalactose transaminase
VARFEEAFRAYKGWGHAVAVNSCTAALHVSMLAAGIRPGDEVITTPLTFCATVNAIIHAGARPVLADINPQTMNLDPREVERSLTSRTRAVLPVHFAGRPCDMDGICDVARRHKLLIIEDCAHAIETEYDGQKAGTFGEFGCFSFYVTKNAMTAEGGMVLARNEEHAARIKTLALHGMNQDAWKRFGDDGYRHYSVVEAGFKYNMTDVQAALGIHQLARIEANRVRREAIWNRYNAELRGLPLAFPPGPETNTRHAYHLYTVGIDPGQAALSRDAFLDAMTRRHIGVGVHYLSLPEHPYYQKRFGWRPQAFPNAMRVGRQTVSLPLSPKLTDDDVSDVIDAVRRVLAEAGAGRGMTQQTRAVA